MTGARTYLDHNATTPMRDEARRAMADALAIYGNPSSVHAEGRKARAAMERARGQVAALVGCAPGEVVFTGSGTEANNLVVHQSRWARLLVPGPEHDSVLTPAVRSEAAMTVIPVGAEGRVDLAALEVLCAEAAAEGGQGLVSVQMANNETGVLQPVAEAAEIAQSRGFAFHTDAVQAAGKIPVSVAAVDADFMTLSAHKLGGPKGVGALIVRDGALLESLISGGGQEMGSRSGTENVPGIVGFGAAAEQATRDLSSFAGLAALRDRLEAGVRAATPQAQVIAGAAARLPNTSCIAHAGLAAETLVIALDLAGIAVSAGAACSSGKVTRSHVLEAMGVPSGTADSAIRVSLGWDTRVEDIDRFLHAWAEVTQTGMATARVA